MKKIYTSKPTKYFLFICLLVSCFSSQTKAQKLSVDSIFNSLSIGATTGLNFPTMKYSDIDLIDYNSALFMRGEIGLFIKIDVTKNISVRPEMIYIGKGQKIDDLGVLYKFKSNYLDWRLPLIFNFKEYSFKGLNDIRPYVMIAPSLGFASGGKIILDDWETNISKASISPFDFSIALGLGANFPISINNIELMAGAEISYELGFNDTYAEDEKNGYSYALNRYEYNINGTRKNRGLAVKAFLSIPLKNVLSLFKQKEESQALPRFVVKEYYTIDEINDMVDAGEDVNDKTIKMDNLNFETGKSKLDEGTKKYLDKIVSLLKKNTAMKMNISGHTDNVGTDELNLDLSQKRAHAVYQYLISQGIPEAKLNYNFFGASKPIIDNDTEEHKAQNRRVEFKIMK